MLVCHSRGDSPHVDVETKKPAPLQKRLNACMSVCHSRDALPHVDIETNPAVQAVWPRQKPYILGPCNVASLLVLSSHGHSTPSDAEVRLWLPLVLNAHKGVPVVLREVLLAPMLHGPVGVQHTIGGHVE